MRIAIVDESATRAAVIREGLAALDDCEIFVVSERRGLVARIGEIEPDIVLMDLGNPSRDVLEEYFAVSRALARPIAMFVDESDDEAIAASIDAGVSSYVVDGLAPHRIRPILDLAVRRFNAFARLQADLAEAQGKLAERDAVGLCGAGGAGRWTGGHADRPGHGGAGCAGAGGARDSAGLIGPAYSPGMAHRRDRRPHSPADRSQPLTSGARHRT